MVGDLDVEVGLLVARHLELDDDLVVGLVHVRRGRQRRREADVLEHAPHPALHLYAQATTMTMAGIVMAQVGAGLAWRTNRRSLAAVGLTTNRLLLAGITLEVAMIALLAYTPGLDRAFHMAPLGPWHWLFLLIWPPLVLAAEEARKAILRTHARGREIRS